MSELSEWSVAELVESLADDDEADVFYYELLSRAVRDSLALQEIHRMLMSLSGQDNYIRYRLCNLLGDVGEPESVAYLVEMLQFGSLVENAAYVALKNIGTPLAVEIAKAHIEKASRKPEKWQALKPRLLELRQQWKREQEFDNTSKLEGWMDEALERDEDEE